MKTLGAVVSILGLVVLGAAEVPVIQNLDWDCVKPTYIIAGDFDGNGWDDIAVACHSCNTVVVGLNPRSNVCPATCPVPWPVPKVFNIADSPVALAWGLFFTGACYESRLVTVTQYQPGWAMFRVTDPSTPKLTPFSGVTATHVALGDFDADGVLDIAILDSLGLKVVFPTSKIDPIDLSPHAQLCHVAFVSPGDFDRDGDLDLVISSSNSLLFFENVCLGKFAFKMSIVLGHMLRGISVTDFDDDGKPDVVVVDPAFSALTVLRNIGCWKFEIAQRIKMDAEPVFVVAGDFDRDAKIDLAVAEFAGNRVTLLRNLGSKFAVLGYVPVGTNPVSLAPGDFDRNGILDLVVALHGGGPTVQVIYNPFCARDDCTGKAPCCQPGTLPECH